MARRGGHACVGYLAFEVVDATISGHNRNGDGSMKRRDVLRGLMVATPATALAVAGAAASATDRVLEESGQSLDACKRRIEELRERLDRSEASAKRAIKVVLALSALSLGIDASTLL